MINDLKRYYYQRKQQFVNKRLLMNYRDIENAYVYQSHDYGLGNFINLTPTIRLLADYTARPVPVFFDLPFIRDCFLDCDFIKVLYERPEGRELFGSSLINSMNNCPDYLHAYKQVTQVMPLSGELPHTYVDTAKEIDAPKYNTLFIRGSGSEDKYYLSLKMPRDEYYKHYFADNLTGIYTQAFTGSQGDIKRSNGLFDGMKQFTGNIRMALALIREADYVVANDSGLAHAAGAMNKPLTLLWKNTSIPKNANPGKHTSYKMCH